VEPRAHETNSMPEALATIAADHSLRHVFVVGSSSPYLTLLVSLLEQKPIPPQLHLMESCSKRFATAAQRYANSQFVHCYYASTVPLNAFPNNEEVSDFYASTNGKLRAYPLSHVLHWLAEDIAAVEGATFKKDGIRSLLELLKIDHFDLAVIDGREFTGFSEFKELYGSKFLLLSCIDTFKNQKSMQQLSVDPNYQLLNADPHTSNGIALFAKR